MDAKLNHDGATNFGVISSTTMNNKLLARSTVTAPKFTCKASKSF